MASGRLLPLAGTPIVAETDPLDAVSLRDRAALRAELRALDANGTPRKVILEPFASIHDERYTVYWPTGPAGERFAKLRALDDATATEGEIIDAVVAGEQQPESDGRAGVHWRAATVWFSCTLADPKARATLLRAGPGRRGPRA